VVGAEEVSRHSSIIIARLREVSETGLKWFRLKVMDMVSYMVDIGSWLALGLCTFEGLGFCGEVVRRDDHRISLVDTVRCEGG